jgi:VWFA-related protein
MMRRMSGVLIFLIGVASMNAQQIGQNKSADQTEGYTLSIQSQLVVEAVVVKDKHGDFVHGLTAKDFALTEDGVPQKIRYCEHQELSTHAEPMPAMTANDEQITIYKHLSQTHITPESIGNEHYNNRRLLVLYFDMTAMGMAEQYRSLSAAEKFIRTQMTSADLLSIIRYGGSSVEVLQDFSADRNKLLSILETMAVGEDQGFGEESTNDASSADTGAAFGQDDGEFNIFNTDRQLAALQTAVQMLGHLNEKKSLIYFAGGLHLNGIDNQAQMHATVACSY